jgi:hypothetical protein
MTPMTDWQNDEEAEVAEEIFVSFKIFSLV